ncbi:MAG: M20/M25/M40 family metallo-hydrolase, partial [Gammaproteobacteria bacterium]|nr:M20/M25/M40 family metallo-hydrolase [Gammaproteobacteria bacterium]
MELFPAKSFIRVHDTITIPQTIEEKNFFFLLHENLKITSNSTQTTIVKQSEKIKADFFKNHPTALLLKEKISLNLYSIHSLKKSEQKSRISLIYEGRIYHPISRIDKEYARGFSETPGIISEKGVFLGGSSCWIPWFNDELMTFTLDLTLPGSWDVISQGKRICHEKKDNRKQTTWDSPNPVDEIFLIANNFTEYKKMCDNVEILTLLRSPDDSLAQRNLSTTCQYLDMYQFLIGPYPYSKFALVENFWETGFGMPSFTLLGSKVIRIPFIINSSYPHEILHNWWGNGVYVDFSTGNWSEGLTAYLADHLIKQQLGQGSNYRLQSLQKYSDYAAKGRDFPLTQFRGRHSTSSEAVGYGKTLMLFNMLRLKIGDRLFIKSLQQFYQNYQFKIASFNDLRKTFELVSGQRLDHFFQQWVARTGAPNLQLGHSEVKKQGKAYQLSFELKQTQADEAYRLQIPVAVTLEGEKKAQQRFINMTQKNQQFELNFPSRPLRLDIDPEFDLFRKLAIQETPPAFTQLFGAHNMLVVLPRSAEPTLKAAWEKFAEDLTRMGPDTVNIKWDDELDSLPQSQAITVLGWNNLFADEMTSALSEHGITIQPDSLKIGKTRIPQLNHSVALTTRYQHNGYFPRAFIATDLAAALPGLGRKLPHYHKYSYLAFSVKEPQNKLKGRWPVSRSPMTVMFEHNATRGKLAKRPALAEAESKFDSTKMMKTIQFLTDESLQGRGFASPGLDKAADYIASAFQQAGLKPAGDNPDSYFQSWQEKGGEPEREARLKNIIGVIPGNHPTLKNENVVIAAHYDHLGTGWPDARAGNKGKIHAGADDNASGVSVLLELARVLGSHMKPDRNIVFVAFSGEEAGRKGSKYYIQHQKQFPPDKSIAMLNLDTVGRLENNKVLVLGGSSASEWVHIFRGIGFVTGIPISMVTEDLDSSDQVSFHEAGVPAVQLFSGANLDYHRPTDSVDKIDSAGLLKIASISQQVIEYLAAREQPLSSNLSPDINGSQTGNRAKPATQRKVSLGSIPDFSFDGDGYRLDGVVPNSPA